jgi:tellurite methyltransferase
VIDPRSETLRYHAALYAEHALFEPGSWLARPARYVLEALAHVPNDRVTQVLDLGAGIGRHTLPIARQLPNARILALDLLPLAVQRLLENAAAWGIADRVDAHVADMEHYHFPVGCFDLIVSCSVLEHLPAAALPSVLARLARATAPSGINCLIIGADRHEITADGSRRPAPIELQIDADTVHALLASSFEGWEVLDTSSSVVRVSEERDGESYVLASRTIRWLVRRPVIDTDHCAQRC